MGMKQILVMMVAVVLVGCGKPSPAVEIVDPIVEKAVREVLEKPKGELTEADCEKVTSINLYKYKITEDGLKDLAKLQKLEELLLRNTKVTDASLKEVAKLQGLIALDLAESNITDAGLKYVVKLKKLKFLRLWDTKVTDEGLKELVKLPNLERLDLTKVSITVRTELEKKLPNCRIILPDTRMPIINESGP